MILFELFVRLRAGDSCSTKAEQGLIEARKGRVQRDE